MRVGQSRKRDWQERSIISELEAIGVTVIPISGVGAPDLLCYSRGTWLAMEVKGPRGRLTSAQVAMRAKAPYPVVRSVAEALTLFGVRS